MPTPDVIQGTDLPAYTDAPAIPDDVATIFYSLLARGIPRFANTDARNAAYPSPAEQQMCAVAGVGVQIVRSGQWTTIWAPTDGVWSNYTPTLDGVTVGNGVVEGRWMRRGRMIHGRVKLTLGTTSSVSGTIGMALPVPQSVDGAYTTSRTPLGLAMAFNGSGRATGIVYAHDAFVARIHAPVATPTSLASAVWGPTYPHTWAAGHDLNLNFEYEAAA